MAGKTTIESATKASKGRKLPMPDVFVILFGFMILVMIMSYIVPAGSYERIKNNGLTQVSTDSFQYIDAMPLGFLDLFTAIHQGLTGASGIIFLILVVGGSLKVIESTGAINNGIYRLIHLAKGNHNVLIVMFCTTFAIFSSVGIAPNLAIAFIPIGLLLSRSLQLDPIVGVSMIFLGAYAGFAGGVFDPVVTVTGQKIAELPLFSGFLFRGVIFLVFLSITIVYICRYAQRVRSNPDNSFMGHVGTAPDPKDGELEAAPVLSLSHRIVLLLIPVAIGTFLYGGFNFGWGIKELSAVFIILGIVTAAICRVTPNDFVKRMMAGANEVMYGALVVGVAAAVIVLLKQASLIDTIVHGIVSSLDGHGKIMAMQLLYAFNLTFNGLITSGTGQAAIVMPIMVPIGDMLEVTRQSTFITFKLGDAVTNIITPLSGTLMACLAIARVSYVEWFRFALPLVLIWVVVGGLFVAIAVSINYGPF
ncbi:YfcC family protein [Halomonas sp. SL1]|nr:AbgT family transporter [Halomonas sp. SL1]RAH37875.1 YfcC family protein [Halomonas sp. SL1]